MVCRTTSCMVAAMLLMATIFVHMNGRPEFMEELVDSPHREQIVAIVNHRRQIAMEGFLLGIVASLILASQMNVASNVNSRALNACVVGSVTLSVQYFYYILSPKNDWILRYLQTDEEIDNWLGMYRKMQQNYHIGALFGLAGTAALGSAI